MSIGVNRHNYLLQEETKFKKSKSTYVAVSHNGEIFVVDSGNHRMQVLQQSEEEKKMSWGKGKHQPVFKAMYGSKGRGEGQFWNPRGVAVAQNGDVFVTDEHRVQVFLNGEHIY